MVKPLYRVGRGSPSLYSYDPRIPKIGGAHIYITLAAPAYGPPLELPFYALSEEHACELMIFHQNRTYKLTYQVLLAVLSSKVYHLHFYAA